MLDSSCTAPVIFSQQATTSTNQAINKPYAQIWELQRRPIFLMFTVLSCNVFIGALHLISSPRLTSSLIQKRMSSSVLYPGYINCGTLASKFSHELSLLQILICCRLVCCSSYSKIVEPNNYISIPAKNIYLHRELRRRHGNEICHYLSGSIFSSGAGKNSACWV